MDANKWMPNNGCQTMDANKVIPTNGCQEMDANRMDASKSETCVVVEIMNVHTKTNDNKQKRITTLGPS